MGLSIVSIKRSEVEGKTEFEEYEELMKALNCNPKNYETTYSVELVSDLADSLEDFRNNPEIFNLTEEQTKQIPELEKIIAVCKTWDLYFCIY